MTNILRHITLILATISSLALPLSASAYGGRMSYDPADTGGIFQTPVKIGGAYVWPSTPQSRRAKRIKARIERSQQKSSILLMRPTGRIELL